MAPVNGRSTYAADAQITYAVYGLINGSWSLLGRQQAYLYGSGYSNGGVKTLYQTDSISVSYNGNVDAFRVVMESVDSGTSGQINGANANWTSQINSGSRSATPNGEKIIATMRPA